jgi:hypothetical protein
MNTAWLDALYTDGLALLCTLLGIGVFLANLRYARDGLPKALRRYLGMKGFVALFAAIVYGATLFGFFDPAPPSALSRSVLGLLLFLMATDVLMRESDAHAALLILKVKRLAEADELLQEAERARLQWLKEIEYEMKDAPQPPGLTTRAGNAEVSESG